jgi:hypothetical protein
LREAHSLKVLEEIKAQFTLAKTPGLVEEIAKTITPALKRSMLADHVNQLWDAYQAACQRLKANGNGTKSALASTLRKSIAEVPMATWLRRWNPEKAILPVLDHHAGSCAEGACRGMRDGMARRLPLPP